MSSVDDEMNNVVKAGGPKRVINDDVDVTARSGQDLEALDRLARRRKSRAKKGLRHIGISVRRPPGPMGNS